MKHSCVRLAAFCFQCVCLTASSNLHSQSVTLVRHQHPASFLSTDIFPHIGTNPQQQPIPNAEDAEKVAKEAEADLNRTLNNAEDLSFTRLLQKDVKLVLEVLMPGQLPTWRWSMPAWTMMIGFAWFIVYALFLYENDREQSDQDGGRRWSQRERRQMFQDERMRKMKPDIMLVFHHPSVWDPDKNDPISIHDLQSFHVDEENSGYLKRLEDCMSKAKEAYELEMAKSFTNTLSKSLSGWVTNSPRQSDAEMEQQAADAEDAEEEIVTVTKSEAREALLQDVCSALPESGFEVACFSSIDDDEIFVAITLNSPEVMRELLIQHGKGLKLQLSAAVVKHLGIGQDTSDLLSSPPHVNYEERLAPIVMGNDSKGKPILRTGDEDDDYDRIFYRTYHYLHKHGSIINSGGRIKLIHKHLQQHLNLDAAKDRGVIKDWYTVHSPHWLESLDQCWARLDLFWDFSFVQPLSMIHDYFGSRVAFVTAWNGLFCKMLLALLPLALAIEFIAQYSSDVSGLVVCFSILLITWSKFAMNLWDREQKFFARLWDLNVNKTKAMRPDFFGHKSASPEDFHKFVRQYPRWKYILRQTFAFAVTIAFCIFDMIVVYTWISGFRGALDGSAAVGLSIIIQVFTLIYNPVADWLTRFENHKFQSDFYDAHLTKLFMFEFINQFFAFFYIAIKQDSTPEGCNSKMFAVANHIHPCVALLKGTLSSTFTVLAAIRIFQLIVSAAKADLLLWWEMRELKKKYREEGKSEDDIPPRGFVEEQAKYSDWRIREQIEGMMTLVISLGYVLIFGAVVPLSIPMCFLVFVVQLRATAYQATTSSRRPLPRVTNGIGSWYNIIYFLMGFGVLFSGFQLVAYGESFKECRVITKLTGFLIFVAAMFFIWFMMDMIVPRTSQGAKTLKARRERVLEKVYSRATKVNLMRCRENRTKTDVLPTKRGCKFSLEILKGNWAAVPHLVDTQEAGEHKSSSRPKIKGPPPVQKFKTSEV